jgi:hypothetical protein
LHQVGDLFELNVKLRCQNVNVDFIVGAQKDKPFLKAVFWLTM